MTSVEEKAPMKTHTFDIKVAFIGYVSVGKSTVLNALLGDKFSEVALKRTTAGANFFRVSQPLENSNSKGSSQEGGWSTFAEDRELQDADAVHEQISKDNEVLRLGEDVGEKTFDIQTNYPICKMRNDTQLLLVDIPGINEADSSKKYKNYVKSNWKTFDCVVVVMDAIQGVNTQEHVDLLEFVKHNNQELRDIPTIVLVNKMDDLEDEDTVRQIHETYLKTVEIFGAVDCCSVAGPVAGRAELTDSTQSDESGGKNLNTAFVPLSAKNAFTYMKAGCIDLEKLGDPKYLDLVNKIGHDEYGRKWNRMKSEKKVTAVSEILQDRTELDERLASTNFNSFIASLSDFVGGPARQTDILSTQMDIELQDLSGDSLGDKFLSESVHEAFKRSNAIGKLDASCLQKTFWKVYTDYSDSVLKAMETRIDPMAFERPFAELEQYHELTLVLEWEEESAKVFAEMKALLRSQLGLLRRKIEAWSFESYCKSSGWKSNIICGFHRYNRRCAICRNRDYPCERAYVVRDKVYSICSDDSEQEMSWENGWISPEELMWGNLSPKDWIAILGSLSLVWDSFRLNEDFGHEKIKLSAFLTRFHVTFDSFAGMFVDCNGLSRENRIFLKAYRDLGQDMNKRIEMPKSLADPSHWGFLAWRYIDFCGRAKRKRIGSNE